MMLRLLALITSLLSTPLAAEEVTVAVAANFLTTAERLAEVFEADTDHEVTVVHGATGAITAQALQGAPFDIVMAADDRRPGLLREEGRASATKPYAFGRLVLISRTPITEDTVAESFAGQTVALADPTVAPYGLAATRAMESLRLDTATFRPVRVADVGQVASVYVTGNAGIAFLAESQLPLLEAPFVLPMAGRHLPIRQDAALLTRAAGNEAAAAFWAFLDTSTARDLIEEAGYDTP